MAHHVRCLPRWPAHVHEFVRLSLIARGGFKAVAIRADKHCRLAEVTTCWQKAPDGKVGAQIDCPRHVLQGRDSATQGSRCASIYVTALGQCLQADQAKGKKK